MAEQKRYLDLDGLTTFWGKVKDQLNTKVDKVEGKHVKITGDEGGVPIDFAFWIQLHEVTPTDTRIRMVLHAELNMMMRMMVGSKIQKGLDQAVEGLAGAFNRF